MEKKLYLGNLPFETKEGEISSLFSKFGQVVQVKLAIEPENGLCRGYGTVEMGTEEEAKRALEGLHGNTLHDRRIKVFEAHAHTEEGYAEQLERAAWGRYEDGTPIPFYLAGG